ncbi:GNAT family N-acetyltransferase [Bacillus sp. CECT 9360]|uniref:GNAT family N-acetyltransferase n=1 Tax=Bacillus sp. CECT 9360 TaxID=2845821 RepID=UPI001E5C6FD1|nr:GNAT family N-acetyltransferase [Bacillus sp. CECT 9360]CAH0344289.1 hypothetical protein BCI9360_00534 [Bacillus sp. CECT 9360]
MLRKIDLDNLLLVKELDSLQKKSYAVEAELIGFYDIPPLKETIEQLMTSQEEFVGYFIDEKLAGAISYSPENGTLVICRLIVDPEHFRKGIAEKLINHLEKVPNHKKIIVSTGKENQPAINLYKKHGFSSVRDMEAAPGFFITMLEKIKKTDR